MYSEIDALQVVFVNNSQGTIASADTGSLVPTEFTTNTLKVNSSP